MGARRNSVFITPCRAALRAVDDYERACELNRKACGKAFSKQAFGILPKIREMDRIMTPDLQDHVREAHPETIFAVLDGTPMSHRKSTAEGKGERLRVLAEHGLEFNPAWERTWLGASRVAEDDLIDATACLLTARRISRGQALTLPANGVERDARGLRMEILA